ncbi:MAG: hypothetical protein LC754_13015 [Acidobacteria bacterium]|nr:hypothetical protein [Acidobacteriota bacterium]
MTCPKCSHADIVKHGISAAGKQRCPCKRCGRQFIYRLHQSRSCFCGASTGRPPELERLRHS